MRRRKKKQGRRGLHNKRSSPDEQAAQQDAAFVVIRWLYSQVLPLWRSCRRGFCRRHKRCCGDRHTCVKRAWPLLSRELQEEAFRLVKAGGPRRLPPSTHTEWELRRFPPTNFVL